MVELYFKFVLRY